MSSEKTVRLLQALHRKTLEGKLAWEDTVFENVYQTSFTNATVRIREEKSTRMTLARAVDPKHAAQERYVMEILDSSGRTIDTFSNEDFGYEIANPYTLMKEIYVNCRRQSVRLEQTLDEVLSELEEEEH